MHQKKVKKVLKNKKSKIRISATFLIPFRVNILNFHRKISKLPKKKFLGACWVKSPITP